MPASFLGVSRKAQTGIAPSAGPFHESLNGALPHHAFLPELKLPEEFVLLLLG